MLKLLQAFFKWQPKPLHHNQFVTVFNNLYQISSEYPATITYKDNGELLAKAVGKVHLYCDGKLVLRLTKNVSVITIGVVDNKAKVINIKKDVSVFRQIHHHHIRPIYHQAVIQTAIIIQVVLTIIIVATFQAVIQVEEIVAVAAAVIDHKKKRESRFSLLI